MEINFKELKTIIAEARKNTYAGGGEPRENASLVGSHQFEYRQGEYFYRDIYFSGKDNFMGQEVVCLRDKPIWSMVYCGSTEPDELSDFLKKSLSTLSEKCRFGEQCEFQEDGFHYKDQGQGTLKRFSGKEEMLINGKLVYTLTYQGGLIVK